MFQGIREWLKRRRHEKLVQENERLVQEYERLVWGNVWYLTNFGTAGPGDPFSQDWINHRFPAALDYIRDSYEAKQPVPETGLLIAQQILVTTIEALTLEEREQVRLEFTAKDRPPSPVGTAIRVLLRNTEMPSIAERVNANLIDIVCRDVMAAVAGNLNAGDRQRQRIFASFVKLSGLAKEVTDDARTDR